MDRMERKQSVPYRQIHMDFHTSPLIPEIGKEFSAEEFGRTLKEAHVAHINLFGKCHHGWFYYPTKIGSVHPQLKFDLLGEQVKACRKYGISYSVYTCVGWNEECASRHPEWQEVSPDGILGNKRPFERDYYQWQTLCLNSGEYREYIKEELEEEYTLFRPKGFWIDIIQPHECVCANCRKKAAEYGLDISNQDHRQRMARMAQINYMKDIYQYLQGLDSGLLVYFNGFAYACDLKDEPEISNAEKRKYVSFMDIESLPSTEWGYSHFPISVNYVNKYSTHDIIMMNGKFHLAWGDFGTLRTKEALEYECYRAVANGAGVCIGDQLHPSGKLEKCVYDRIGEVFKELEKTEKWCTGTEKVAQIGVYSTVRSSQLNANSVDSSMEGVYRVLTEQKYQYDILDLTDPIEQYELLIMPDHVYLNKNTAERIERYVENGGKLLITGFSGVENEEKFILKCIPVIYRGKGKTVPRYMDLKTDRFGDIPAMRTVSYSGGAFVEAKTGAEVLCETVDSYFDRDDTHFCSHRQTPPKVRGEGEPCIVASGNVIYISNCLFQDIAEYGVKAYKNIVSDLLGRLIEKPYIKTDLPSYAEVSVRSNGNDKIIHILNYIVQRKCRCIDTVEETVPLYNRTLKVRCGNIPKNIEMITGTGTVRFEYADGYAVIRLSELQGRTVIRICLG